MKILVTGFDPFGGESINPAYEAVKELPDQIQGATIIKKEIPTEFKRSGEVLKELALEYKPDVILCVGQAGGRSGITVERVAINLAEARIADNVGFQPSDMEIIKGGKPAYFATIPVKNMVEKIRERGLQGNISYTAGTFVCNSIMYNALAIAEKEVPGAKAGFIHVPFLPEQVTSKVEGTPSMSKESITAGLQAAIEAIIEYDGEQADIKVGETH